MTLRRTNNQYKSGHTEIEFIGDEGNVYLLLSCKLTKQATYLFENEGIMQYVYESICSVISDIDYLPNEARVKENVLRHILNSLRDLIEGGHSYALPITDVIAYVGVWFVKVSDDPFIQPNGKLKI